LPKVDVLDCTLRDGAYTINFQFTLKDTLDISQALEKAGFKFIEIGHGLGLNASSCKGKALHTDAEYLSVAQQFITKSKYGMFFIPGIGRKEDLEMAVNYDMGFVRVGTNITQADEAVEYIKTAKDYGLITTSNLMKSYVLPPEKFIKKVQLVDKIGVDYIEIVDSAGCMMPKDIKEYFTIMNKHGIMAQYGFHGHNNLSLAVANTLEAIEYGATLVDSALLGLGRGAGNTSTEILVTVLNKLGYNRDIDIFQTMDVAEKIVRPIIERRKGLDSIAITCGYTEFHSSYLYIIYDVARQYQLDPRKLMVEVCKIDKVNLTKESCEKIAERMKN